MPFTNFDWKPEQDLIFSSRDGFVWVSWPGAEAAVRLGRHETVAAMMRDFLAQDALGTRLTKRRRRSREQGGPESCRT
jgi:hypothetical protein